MPEINVFLLLPESSPSNQWMRTNNEFLDQQGLSQFIFSLNENLGAIEIENFTGYFDLTNVDNFLHDYNILEDYYPFPATRLLRKSISSFYNWRPGITHNTQTAFFIFGQPVANHSFVEIAQRKSINPQSFFLILNQQGHILPQNFVVSFEENTTRIDSFSEKSELVQWFIENRLPKRNFHIIEKHGEDRHFVKRINNKIVSPLRCSQQHANNLLQSAIGFSIKELFNIDKKSGYYLVFKYEGRIPENIYHGYHVNFESGEVPDEIKERLERF